MKATFFILRDVIFLVRGCWRNLELISLGSEGANALYIGSVLCALCRHFQFQFPKIWLVTFLSVSVRAAVVHHKETGGRKQGTSTKTAVGRVCSLNTPDSRKGNGLIRELEISKSPLSPLENIFPPFPATIKTHFLLPSTSLTLHNPNPSPNPKL